jgi:hypothetical protein
LAFLARPELLDAPERETAAAAGTSRQAVRNLRDRLLAEGLAVRSSEGNRWAPRARRQALDRWLVGYSDLVRPRLMFGAYRTQNEAPEDLEHLVLERLGASSHGWRWGGSAAGYRLLKHYRGKRTVVHLERFDPWLPRELLALLDPEGPLVLMGFPGPVAMQGATPDTAHPLLVCSEMIAEGGDRPREAALAILEKYTDLS